MDIIDTENNLKAKIKILNETLWEYKVLEPTINNWLANFTTENEKIHALYLLSKFMYFGAIPMKLLIKYLYKDLFRSNIIKNIRKANGNTLDGELIEGLFLEEVKKTRFLGIGNPSESGPHLLYLFRQENKLPTHMFLNTDGIIREEVGGKVFISPEVNRYIFIDDFCGSGSQVTNDKNIMESIDEIRILNPNIEVNYLMLFGTESGIHKIRKSLKFDNVEACIEFDDSYKCFGKNSRIFPNRKDFAFNKKFTEEFCFRLGRILFYDIHLKTGHSGQDLEDISDYSALGWGNCQLLLGFSHNTPDNTLPIIWYDETGIAWTPIFKRYNKIYS